MGIGYGSQDPLQAAIQSRMGGGAPVPQLNQTMQGSPQPSQPTGQAPTPIDQPQGASKPPSSEAELIVKALSQRLGLISKVEAPQTEGM